MNTPKCKLCTNETDGTALVTLRTVSCRTFCVVTMTADGETMLEIIRDELTLHKMPLSVAEPKEKP